MGAWGEWRPVAWDMVSQYLSRPNAFAKGMSARSLSGHLGDHIETDTQIINGEIVITCRIPNNYFQFYVTTPDVVGGVGVSRDADPKMEVFADCTATLRIPVDGIMENLRVSESSFAIKINKVDSQNFTGDVTLFLADTITSGIKLLGGPDYWAKAMNKVEKPRDFKDSVKRLPGTGERQISLPPWTRLRHPDPASAGGPRAKRRGFVVAAYRHPSPSPTLYRCRDGLRRPVYCR